MQALETYPSHPRPIPLQADTNRLITADAVRRIAGGISDMTLWRWLQRGILPQPLVIERRRYWWRDAIVDALDHAGRSAAEDPSSDPTEDQEPKE